MIAAAGDPLAGIRSVFDCMVDDMIGGSETCGCLVNNAAAEMASHDAATAARVCTGLGCIEQSFFGAVERGQAEGLIEADRDARALARYLASSVQGLIIMGRANPDRETLEDIVRVTLSALE